MLGIFQLRQPCRQIARISRLIWLSPITADKQRFSLGGPLPPHLSEGETFQPNPNPMNQLQTLALLIVAAVAAQALSIVLPLLP